MNFCKLLGKAMATSIINNFENQIVESTPESTMHLGKDDSKVVEYEDERRAVIVKAIPVNAELVSSVPLLQIVL